MNIFTIQSLYDGSLSKAAVTRILKEMGFTCTSVSSIEPVEDEKALVTFYQGKQPYRIRLSSEHFLRDYFRQRWQKSFDYDILRSDLDPSLALATQGGNTQKYWIKTHAPGHYECDCPDWIAQHSARGVAVCKHAIRLGQLEEVSISDMLAAQTAAPAREAVG